MANQIEQLKEDIAMQMQEWAALFIQERIAYLRRRKTSASGGLISSMQSQVTTQARQEAVELLISFEEHGRFLDMRRLQAASGGQDYIEAIQEWIKDKGLEQKLIAGYRRRYPGKIPNDVLNKIAWGIATKRAGKVRRKAWWNKPKSAAITDLFNEVAASIPDEVAKQIREQFKSK